MSGAKRPVVVPVRNDETTEDSQDIVDILLSDFRSKALQLRRLLVTLAQAHILHRLTDASELSVEALLERINYVGLPHAELLDAIEKLKIIVRSRLAKTVLEGDLYRHLVIQFIELFDRLPTSRELALWNRFLEELVAQSTQ